jgi:hypothetical protein
MFSDFSDFGEWEPRGAEKGGWKWGTFEAIDDFLTIVCITAHTCLLSTK